jgi:serine/threonine-protein kinase
MPELIGTQLGQYQLIAIIRRGGMATVYKAYQPILDRHVAVKVLHNRDSQFAVRFKREARAIAQLQHHNILPIYDYGEQDGLLYLVLQYIENGTTLGDILGRPIEPVAALRLTARLLDALAYAHQRGIIHRDIKPANILMPSPTWPMLADFGIAKLLNDDLRLTQAGMIVGTAAYMAPEQAEGRPIDSRTDLYAVGVVLYEMLTGRVPFDATTPVAVLMKHAYEPPPPPRSLNPDLPPAAEAVLLRALAKDPDARYQSAAEMGLAVERVANQLEQEQLRTQLASLYQAGQQAFAAGQWELAIERLSQLAALDPSYKDSADLLAAAHARAQAEARQQMEVVRQSPPHTIQPLPATAVATIGPLATAASSPVPATEPAPAHTPPITVPPQPQEVPARSKRWLWIALGSTGLLVLVVALLLVRQAGSTAGALAEGTAVAQRATAAPPTAAPARTPEAGALTTQVPTAPPTVAPTFAPTALPTDAPTLAPTAPPPTTPPATPSLEPTTVSQPEAAVNIARLKLRAGPGESFPVLATLDQGTLLKVRGREATGQWVQVEAADGLNGWMATEYLQLNVALADVPVVEAPRGPALAPTARPRATPRPTVQPTAVPQPTLALPPTPEPPPPPSPTTPPAEEKPPPKEEPPKEPPPPPPPPEEPPPPPPPPEEPPPPPPPPPG